MDQIYLPVKWLIVPLTLKPNWEAIAFPKGYSTRRNQCNEKEEISATTSEYARITLKCCEDEGCEVV